MDAAPQVHKKGVSRKKPPWPPHIKPLIQESKAAHKKWRTHPTRENQLSCKDAKRCLRSAQRCVVAYKRTEHIRSIMVACQEKSSSLFKLVKPAQQQNKEVVLDFAMDAEGKPRGQLEGWRMYLQDLATPKEDTNFNEQYRRKAEFQHLLIQQIEAERESTPIIQQQDVMKYMAQLKPNKAADVYGITTEHLKLADPIISYLLTKFVQSAYTTRQFPAVMKLGAVTPVVKKDKPVHCPDSYRRITVTPVTGKLIEKAMLTDAKTHS